MDKSRLGSRLEVMAPMATSKNTASVVLESLLSMYNSTVHNETSLKMSRECVHSKRFHI